MPKTIRLSGVVISDRDAYIYDYYGIPNISPRGVLKHLDDANGEDVEIYISSNGGNAFSGSEIYTSIKEYAGHVTVKIPSIAASAASIMAAAADKVLISPTGQIMIHNSATWTEGNKERHQQTTQMLGSVDEGMLNAYVSKTGRSPEEIRQFMKEETFMNAQRAVELGFADEIMFATEGLTAVASTDFSEFGTMLPPEVLDKMRIELRAKGIGPETFQTTEPVAIAIDPIAPQSGLKENEQKEGLKPMDINELKANHPDLVSEITNQAITAERARIASINAMAGAPGAAAFINDAIANGDTAGDVAMKIVEASAKRVTQEAGNRQKDADDSNAANVETQQPADPGANDAADEDAAVENTINFATEFMNKRGGRG